MHDLTLAATRKARLLRLMLGHLSLYLVRQMFPVIAKRGA